MKLSPLTFCIAATCFALSLSSAQSELPLNAVRLDSFLAFETPESNWQLISNVTGDPRHEASFSTKPGVGVIANIAPRRSGSHLFTAWEHGDIELELEFLMPKGSNSGVYLQSRYEVQLFDSWGVENPKFSDCGGIYERYIEDEKYGYEGVDPKLNACRAPGLWQRLRIEFRAPRFDETGNKIENARFVKVVLNGFTLHENVEVTGPTRSAAAEDEVAIAPVMIQGDHGPVAFRNIAFKPLGGEGVSIDELSCVVRLGKELEIGDYDDIEPDYTPEVTHLDLEDLEPKKNFAATYTGTLQISTTGTYAFTVSGRGTTKLVVGEAVALDPLSGGGRTVPIYLEAGKHAFRLDYLHAKWGEAKLNLQVEGPDFGMRLLTPEKIGEEEEEEEPNSLVIQPFEERVRLQRAFIPYEPRKRLYAVAVGSPEKVHYAYDFDTGSILHAWNGDFLDTFEIWDGRGVEQIAKPVGPLLTFSLKPTVAFFKKTDDDWPNVPDPVWSPKGYTLDEKGQPEFYAQLAELKITDKIIASNGPRNLHRSLKISGGHSRWQTGVLLVEANVIENQGNGRYIVDDRTFYVDVPPDNELPPFVRRVNGRDQLMVWVPSSNPESAISYNIIW
ncbi:DUF1080 domain-containing protein [Puniceicoccaceae bacterium K14]|nr:DUF1080 domain-containing protein [Puniceicoccaceae bacterium K14]